jgi:hypothetical protein
VERPVPPTKLHTYMIHKVDDDDAQKPSLLSRGFIICRIHCIHSILALRHKFLLETIEICLLDRINGNMSDDTLANGFMEIRPPPSKAKLPDRIEVYISRVQPQQCSSLLKDLQQGLGNKEEALAHLKRAPCLQTSLHLSRNQRLQTHLLSCWKS